MIPSIEDSACLWVEAVKLRPSAEKVLRALVAAEDNPESQRLDVTAPAIAQATELSAHVVRARLCDLRRLGLAHSYYSKRLRRAVHGVTDYGYRRHQHGRV